MQCHNSYLYSSTKLIEKQNSCLQTTTGPARSPVIVCMSPIGYRFSILNSVLLFNCLPSGLSLPSGLVLGATGLLAP